MASRSVEADPIDAEDIRRVRGHMGKSFPKEALGGGFGVEPFSAPEAIPSTPVFVGQSQREQGLGEGMASEGQEFGEAEGDGSVEDPLLAKEGLMRVEQVHQVLE